MPANRRHTLARAAIFATKRRVLQLRRSLSDRRMGLRAARLTNAAERFPFLLAEECSPLWSEESLAERGLQLGKVQNLRIAVRQLNGAILPANALFSFWKQVGSPTARRGFVAGRELREGCMIPAIGGGICQLSNALYAVAIAAGGDIVERHAHSQVVPGSSAAAGRDATVAYNYIDLRFRFPDLVRIEAQLTSQELIVRVLGKSPLAVTAEKAEKRRRIELLTPSIGSCVSCGEDACFRHVSTTEVKVAIDRTAFLLAGPSPEFERYTAESRQENMALLIPLDGHRWNLRRYAVPTAGFHDVRSATLTTLRQAVSSRLARDSTPALRRERNRLAVEALARTYGGMLRPDETHLVIDQELLPTLWRDGTLGGRTFDVLMSRPALADLQARLDDACNRWPESTTLGDYRAPADAVRAEAEALESARYILTSHPELRQQFGARAVLVPGVALSSSESPRPPTPLRKFVVFPGPTVGRKGCYELREAIRELGLSLVVLGRNLEGDDFWHGIDIRHVDAAADLRDAAVIVQPSLWETHPSSLVRRALALGIPVITTPGTGLGEREGVKTVPFGDADALKAALRSFSETRAIQ